MTWSFFGWMVLVAAAFAAGFCLGRRSGVGGVKKTETGNDDGGYAEGHGHIRKDRENVENRREHGRRDRRRGENMTFTTVGSPVSGEIAYAQEGEHPTVVIEPGEDKLYAPANGKIIRLYPMGNEFLFRTEFGDELRIQAGDAKDELLVRFFRPRIVQNEIVGKGKLLLEFDRKGLEAEGSSSQVTVRLESSSYGSDVWLATAGRVKTGEEILQVQEPYRHDGIHRD